MYLKYKSVDINTYNKTVELAMFQGITYDYNCGCCRISFIGNYVDILKKMNESEYRETVAIFTNVIKKQESYLELDGIWIFDFEDNIENWDEHFSKALNIIY